jgi:hypothetical protein
MFELPEKKTEKKPTGMELVTAKQVMVHADHPTFKRVVKVITEDQIENVELHLKVAGYENIRHEPHGEIKCVLLDSEKKLLEKIQKSGKVKINKVWRRSSRMYDLSIEGVKHTTVNDRPLDMNFSAWIPLQVIRSVNWIKFAGMSDYPEMVHTGDWSGIRDSSSEAIWEMFSYALKMPKCG